MKNLKKLLPVFALVLGLGLVLTQSAFTSKVDTYWVFDGSSVDDAKEASLYHEDASAPICVSGSTMPCRIKTDAAIDNETALQAYLNTFSTPEDVLASTTDKKD